MRYNNIESVITKYGLEISNNIKKGQSAKAYLKYSTTKDKDGNITANISFVLTSDGKKIGPISQVVKYNKAGNFKIDDEFNVEDKGIYIEIQHFYIQFPDFTLKKDDKWEEVSSISNLEGDIVKLNIVNMLKNIDYKTKICEIVSKGEGEDKKYQFIRRNQFDFDKGIIIKSEVKIMIKSKDGNIISDIKLINVK
ncbi:MAG: hypothetical protein M0Q02_08210 [Candidatus Muirbacterium halophilum]|nr:hypothetical protein [Candidatus Muirbacterium halophilum]